MLSLLVQLLAVWSSPEVAHLIESGLHDSDRHKRANALEALESLGERRFIRLFLPLLESDAASQDAWIEVAERQWGLGRMEVSVLLHTCLLSANPWVAIGAMLSAQARPAFRDDAVWQARLQELTTQAGSPDVRDTACQMLGCAHRHWHLSLSLTATMLFLKRVPMYSTMTLEQLRTIAGHLTERSVAPEESIFHEGDLSLELYLIVSGKVAILRQRPDNMPHVLVTLGAGDFFGDMAIFENRPRSAGAVALERSVLLVFSPEHFRQVIMQDPAISFEIFRALSARIRRFNTDILAMAQRA
jgi:Cyclic nucleotide-binding domain